MKTLLLAISVIFAAGCGRSLPNWPVSETSRPFSELNETMRGRAPAVAQTVTYQRLLNARSEPQNWLTYYGTYDGQRFSTLNQINTENVRSLRPAWVFRFSAFGLTQTPATYTLEAAPIVVDGVMYLSGFDGHVWALDAATGDGLWQYKHATPLDIPLCCGNVNRGVAVAQGRVFYATQGGHLVALDAATGKEIWDVPFVDPRAGESATAAPLVVKNMVIVGSSGAEYGVRGHIDAFDIQTGRRIWRRYPVPAPGEPGSETWPSNEAWARGGGTAWITGTYDPDLDLLYWGTANPSPVFDGGPRSGTNLYTSSVLALDPDDGSIRWHYQWTPHDVWDYDGVNENILFERDGRRLLAHFDKNGHFFVLDRTNGQLVHVSRFARVTWGEIDARGVVTPRIIPTPQGVDICPGPAGAKEWNHAAYHPETRLFYVPVIEACARFKRGPTVFAKSLFYLGGEADVRPHEQWGELKAIDPATGNPVWTWRSEQPLVASVLTTAGGLVFVGQPNGKFNALNARSGELLWSFQTGNGIHSNPVTYSVAGKQYIAVPAGWGGWVEGFAPEMFGAPRGTALHVFALP
jgi:alcohol dehydrogenase (cytochrome c)